MYSSILHFLFFTIMKTLVLGGNVTEFQFLFAYFFVSLKQYWFYFCYEGVVVYF